MNLYLYQNGQPSGPYNMYYVKSCLAAGQIRPTELACYEGSTAWAPLNTLPGIDLHLHHAQPRSGGGTGAGWVICIAGLILALAGLLLSLTVLGAIIGVPLLLLGIPIMLVGRHMVYRGMRQKLYESAREGAAQAIYPYLAAQRQSQPAAGWSGPAPSGASATCSACGEGLVEGASFCGKCGATVISQ